MGEKRTVMVLLELHSTAALGAIEHQLIDLYSKDADAETELAQIHVQVAQPAK